MADKEKSSDTGKDIDSGIDSDKHRDGGSNTKTKKLTSAET